MTVSYEDFFPGNFGAGGVKSFLRKKRFLRGNFYEKFLAQNFLETRGNFTRFVLDHLIIELKSVPLPQYWMMPTMYTQLCSLLYSHIHASSHTNVAPRALTNVRGRTAVLAGMMIDFLFSVRARHVGDD